MALRRWKLGINIVAFLQTYSIEWGTMKPATAKRSFSTPMMKQYMEIKEQYQDCLLFFRLGDFYEMFLEDAVIGSKILDIVLTKRPRGKDGDIPMAGVPYHSAENYIAKLIKTGHKVAICEQVSEPDKRGIVDREVIRIITPGTVLDENSLTKNSSNYIMALSYDANNLGVAFLDISTGSFQVTQIEHQSNHLTPLIAEIKRFSPVECVLSLSQYADHNLLKTISSATEINIYNFDQWDEFAEQSEDYLQKHFGVEDLSGFGLNKLSTAQQAASAILGYVENTQRKTVPHITKIQTYNPYEYLHLDESTIRNLELLTTLRDNQNEGSFIYTIDKTKTAMGGRLLKEWLRKPLHKIESINQRLDSVETLIKNGRIRNEIASKLVNVRDVERVISRLSVGLGNAKDLNLIKENLNLFTSIKEIIPQNTQQMKSISKKVDIKKLNRISKLIQASIVDDPPTSISEGGIFKSSVNKELDKLHQTLTKGSEWLSDFEKQEKEKTKIPTLKVKFNKVFGFYIDVSKSQVNKVPENYERRQTTVNGERFVTEELKRHEREVLTAEDRVNKLEQKLFNRLIDEILKEVATIQQAANAIAELDCLLSFSETAKENKYSKPIISSKKTLNIIQGRHPVVEQMVAKGEFVPNDTLLDDNRHQLIILTGPNMAGKSVYIRQVAIITLMAHLGMFVPADEAEIPLTDRIFVRSGASDMISSGLSTFMTEMVETANILNHATNNSLVVMDEVGRGTSTYDGISIASSIVEYLLASPNKRAKTLFATHYHELQELEDLYPSQVKNYQMDVKEDGENVIFLHTISQGRASHSYGVAVAQKAGVPAEITDRARKKLKMLEISHKNITKSNDSKIKQLLHDININELSPIEALNKLSELKNILDD